MAKKNETLETLAKVMLDRMDMRNKLFWTVVRFGVCMAVLLALLVGVGLGRMLSVGML